MNLAVGKSAVAYHSLLFDLALKEALGRGRSEGNIYLICDEFRLLPYLQHIDDGVNFGRSMGVKVIAACRASISLPRCTSSAGANIAAGFSTVMAFRANDRDTREYVSGLFGRNYIKEEYRTLANSGARGAPQRECGGGLGYERAGGGAGRRRAAVCAAVSFPIRSVFKVGGKKMSGDSDFLKAFGVSSAIANAAANRKTLKKAIKCNNANRGVTVLPALSG
jgi:hypothetical protein